MKKVLISTLVLLAVTLASAEDNKYKLSCGGTEPFWSIFVNGPAVTFVSPGLDDVVYLNAKSAEAAGMSEGVVFQIKATRLKGKQIQLSVTSGGEQGCSDGMSDQMYKYHVLVNMGTTVLYGCCN